MTTIFSDYQQLVMRMYERKKANNTLPHGLKHLTPAKLKDECVKRCTKDVSRRDEKVIRDFCGDLNESRNCHIIIQRCDTDRFRPLVNYLKGKSDRTEEKNIELLAWLIDFRDRPWELGKEISGDDDTDVDLVLNNDDLAAGDTETVPVSPPNTPVGKEVKQGEGPVVPVISKEREERIKGPELRRKPTKTLAAAIMLSLVLGTGSMWWWKSKTPDSGDCMYWLEDHYEPIACDQKIPNTMIIALDAMRLKNFRKITRPDTLTYHDIGKVWYSKINGNIEYFTSGGAHPVVFGRELKPVTPYIIDKHILTGIITK